MKSLKSLLIPFIVMLVLVGVAIGVVISNSKESGTSETEVASSEDVITVDPSLISTIEVVRQDGTGIGFRGAPDDTGSITWSLMDQYSSDVPLNNSGITSWVYVLSSFMSNNIIGDSSQLDLAEYGLDDPVYTIVITQYNGTVNRIFVGNKTADGGSCYFMVEGNPIVYTVVTAKYVYCGYQLIDFLESVTLGIDYASLSTVEFIRAMDDLDLVTSCTLYDTGDPMFTAVSPFSIECSPYFTSLIDKIVNLEITSFVDIPEDMLSDFGLDAPSYEFNFNMDDGRVVNITLSSDINGFFYGTSNVVDGYFKISDMQISGVDTQIMMLLNSYLVYYAAADMSKITGTYGDQSFTYEISTTGSISADDATANLNYRNAKVFTSEGRSFAAILYESLITISVSDIDLDANPTGDPVIEFTYITNNYETLTLSFVPRDNNSYYAFLNGEYTSFVVSSSELFNDGGQNTYIYGAWRAYELTEEAIDNAVAGVYDIPSEEAA